VGRCRAAGPYGRRLLQLRDTPLNRAFIRKTMIGMVGRARVPGSKFDTITVLESKEGFNKSTAWKVLAGEENFSDESIIGKSSREVQEQLSEVGYTRTPTWLASGRRHRDRQGIRKPKRQNRRPRSGIL